MKALTLLTTVILTMIAFMAIGCSDDDECPTCPTSNQVGIVYGEMTLDGGDLEFYAVVTDIDGTMPDVDSVIIDGNRAQVEQGYWELGAGTFAEYEGPQGALDSGDTLTVLFYLPAGIAQARVKILDYDDDSPTIQNWEVNYPYDTVALGEDITVTWNAVSSADYYMCYTSYYYYDADSTVYEREFRNITGTSFTIPGAQVDENGRYYISVRSMTGPIVASGATNVTGGVLKGVIGSSAYESFDIIVGNGPQSPVPSVEPDTRMSLPEIMLLQTR